MILGSIFLNDSKERELQFRWTDDKVELLLGCCMNYKISNNIQDVPVNILLDEEVLIEDVFRLRLQKTSSGRFQHALIKTNIFALLIHLQKTSSIRPQDVLSSSSRCLQSVFKTFQNVFKTFSRYHQDVLQICLSKPCQEVSPS